MFINYTICLFICLSIYLSINQSSAENMENTYILICNCLVCCWYNFDDVYMYMSSLILLTLIPCFRICNFKTNLCLISISFHELPFIYPILSSVERAKAEVEWTMQKSRRKYDWKKDIHLHIDGLLSSAFHILLEIKVPAILFDLGIYLWITVPRRIIPGNIVHIWER